METLKTFYPDIRDLLNTEPQDLAPILLKFARATVQNGMFWPETTNNAATGANDLITQPPIYSFYEREQIEFLLTQTWSWLERNGLIARASGMNGRNGWMIFTKQGEEISDAQDFRRLREAAEFPKSLLHPLIAEKVWRALMRSDLDEAVFAAFKAVEEAVRSAGGFAASDIGVPLMRKAFDKNTGPLTDMSPRSGTRCSSSPICWCHRVVQESALTPHREPH
jgi:hypothetical protein